MKNFIASMTVGMSIAVPMFLLEIAQAHIGWRHTYYCGEYTITLNEYAREQYSYHARSRYGNLFLSNGDIRNNGNSWIYSFYNANTTYELKDPWQTRTASLKVLQNGQLVLERSCQK